MDGQQSEYRYDKLLNQLNQKLTPDQLQCLILKAAGKSNAEIARELKKNSEEAVRTTIHRARKIAKNILKN